MTGVFSLNRREAALVVVTILITFTIIGLLHGHVLNFQILVGLIITTAIVLFLYFRQNARFNKHLLKGEKQAADTEKQNYFFNNPIPMWIYEKGSLRFLEVNNAAIEKYGYSREEFQNMNLLSIRPKKDYRPLLDYMDNELKPFETGDTWRHLSHDGNEMYVKLDAHEISFEGKEARLVAIHDFTEVMQSRNRYKEQRKFLGKVLENIRDMVWIIDANLQLIDYNQEYYRFMRDMYGIDIKQDNLAEAAHNNMSQKKYNEWADYFKRALEGKTVTFESTLPSTSGNRYFQIELNPVTDTNGLINFVVCVSSEVTRYAKTNEKLKEALREQELFSEATSDSLWDLDLVANEVRWGAGIANSFGYNVKTTSLEWWEDKIHPNDRDKVTRSLNKAINSNEDHWQEYYQFQNAQGDYHYVLDKGYVMRDKDGNAFKMVGAIQDLDEVIRSKQKISKLSEVASKTTNAVIITDEQEHIEWVNEGFTQLTGYTFEEAEGLRPQDFLQGPKTDPSVLQSIRADLNSGNTCSAELINYHKNGQPYWVEMIIDPIIDEEGNKKFISIESNITNRKKQQQLLELKNEKLREIAMITAHDLRKPLANVLGLANLIEARQDNTDQVINLIPLLIRSSKELDERLNLIVKNSYDGEFQQEDKSKRINNKVEQQDKL